MRVENERTKKTINFVANFWDATIQMSNSKNFLPIFCMHFVHLCTMQCLGNACLLRPYCNLSAFCVTISTVKSKQYNIIQKPMFHALIHKSLSISYYCYCTSTCKVSFYFVTRDINTNLSN